MFLREAIASYSFKEVPIKITKIQYLKVITIEENLRFLNFLFIRLRLNVV